MDTEYVFFINSIEIRNSRIKKGKRETIGKSEERPTIWPPASFVLIHNHCARWGRGVGLLRLEVVCVVKFVGVTATITFSGA